VLPMIAQASEQLARRHGLDQNGDAPVGDVVVPIAFNFPTAGKLLTLLFVPFAAWMAGHGLDASQYPGLIAAGVTSYFAKAQVALPFLLDLVDVPQDLFQLYIPTTLINGKFDSMVGAMSLLAFALITGTAMAGRLRIDVVRLLRFVLVSVASLAATVLAVGLVLARVVDTTDTKAEALRNIYLSRSIPPFAVYDDQPPPVDEASMRLDSMQRVLDRRALRVGYFEDRVPFSFRNSRGDLVGYDIEMAAQMALDLGVTLELVAVTNDNLQERLKSGQVDVVAGVRYTHHWVRRLRMSEPYTDVTIGLLVRDARREEFGTLADIRAHPRLTFGVFGDRDLGEDYVKAFAGDTPYWIVHLTSVDDLAGTADRPVDASVVLAESGMAWSLLHPEYTVVIPRNALIRRSLAFGLDIDSDRLGQFVDEWVRLQQVRGATKLAYDYWVLGKGTEKRAPRWSIARDVLHLAW
jgi:ABC-type amino acid transport substrate-binding protein